MYFFSWGKNNSSNCAFRPVWRHLGGVTTRVIERLSHRGGGDVVVRIGSWGGFAAPEGVIGSAHKLWGTRV